MAIDAKTVKQLRDVTGAGMMDCKKALNEVGGDIDAAIDYLRKQGLKASEKKAGRIAAEGIIATSSTTSAGAVLELNCETDFVAKNPDFIELANQLVALVETQKPQDVNALLELDADGQKVSEKINLITAKIGEKITIRRFALLSVADGESLGSYIHTGSKIGVLIKLKGQDATGEVAKDVAMHVAAQSPQNVRPDDIDPALVQKEKEVFLEQLKESGKPENILEKIVEGKIKKFKEEVSLTTQVFVKDPQGKKTVGQFLKENGGLDVIDFIRYQVGEGIEKKADDFASEVAQLAK